MKTRRLVWSLLILWRVCAIVPAQAQTETEPPPGYRQLPDLRLFADQPYGQWVGSGDGLLIETTDGGQLPIDSGETYAGFPSYRVNITREEGQWGWWSFILAGNDWENFSIAPYVADGALEFNVKGSAGGEDFKISLQDRVPSRSPSEMMTPEITLSSVQPVTDEWQHVRIPLSSFVAAGSGFAADEFFTLVFTGANAEAMTFWLNDIKFTSGGEEPGHPAIKLNQVGYTPPAVKVAHVTGFDEALTAQVGTPFSVRSLSNNQVVYQGELEPVAAYDAVVSGERVLAADFSGLTAPGDYYLSVDAYQMADSPPFAIGADVYDELLADSLRYLYLQRSGLPLAETYAGQFARGAGHMQDAEAAFRSGAKPPVDVAGGWYDAGDYGKYVNAGATAVSDLLWAYETFPEQFPDGQLNIPESGNGIPDLLDEARWELDWLLKMQDPDSGGFYHMVQPTEQTTIPTALEPRFIEDEADGRENVRPTGGTGSAAAALAHASLVFAEFDAEYAATLLAAAENGWDYLQANPDGVAPVAGPYSDADDRDDRFWAATALYRATGGDDYHDYVKQNYKVVESFFTSEEDNAYGVGKMEMVAWLHYMAAEEKSPELAAYFAEIFGGWSERMVGRWQESAWNIALMDDDFYWGSNLVVMTTPMVLVIGSELLGERDETAVIMAQQALDYLLGNNPLRFSYISGYGADSLSQPFSTQWSLDGMEAVPPGILAGGPNAYDNPLLYSNFAGKRYVDSAGAWTTNEHTIYWNSALVFTAALAAEVGGSVTEPMAMPEIVSTVAPAALTAGETAVITPESSSSQPETAVVNTELQTAVTSLRQLLLLVGGIGLVLIGVVIVCTLLVLRAVRRGR
ncbi:MAG: glycoside hydrolase family 9 protein [Chloroflexota bacterium]